MKKALITGIAGQDGAFLAKKLIDEGYKVFGADRRRSDSTYKKLEYLGIENKVEFIYFDLLEYSNIYSMINDKRPNEIYNLAAQSFVKASFDQPITTSDINSLGPLRILESIRHIDPSIKFYQASTSEMFGKIQDEIQTENTKFYPRSPYGVGKLFAHWMTKNYRESYGIFACSGILFNHESEFRGSEFVTKKIVEKLTRIKKGEDIILSLGNINAMRDWGHAEDYVEGMYLMLQQDKPDDYVLATGKTYSVRDFVNIVCEILSIKIQWKGKGIDEKGIDINSGNVIVNISPEFFRPAEVDVLIGDPTKALKHLEWKPKHDLKSLAERMVNYELKVNK